MLEEFIKALSNFELDTGLVVKQVYNLYMLPLSGGLILNILDGNGVEQDWNWDGKIWKCEGKY